MNKVLLMNEVFQDHKVQGMILVHMNTFLPKYYPLPETIIAKHNLQVFVKL